MQKSTKIFSRVTAAVIALCMLACFLTACGSQEFTLNIKDGEKNTEAKAKVGQTVAEILEANSVNIGDKDETVPAISETVTADTAEITVKRYAKVTVVYGKEKKEVEIVGGTVEDAIKSAGFKLENGVEPDVDPKTYLKNGMTITLKKGVTVKLTTSDGKTAEVATSAATVKEFLEEQQIVLADNETVSPKLTDKITDGMTITIKEKKEEATEAATEAEATEAPAADNNDSNNSGSDNSSDDNSGSDDSSDEDSDDSSSDEPDDGGVYEVNRQDMPDCDGSGHGYYIVTYSDGSVKYEEY